MSESHSSLDSPGVEPTTGARSWPLGWLIGPRAAWQFSIASLVVVVIVGAATLFFVERHISSSLKSDAVQESVRDGEWLARMIERNLSADKFASPVVDGSYDELDREIGGHVLSPSVVLVKLWNTDATIIYSDRDMLVGLAFPENDRVTRALEGETVAYSFKPADRPDLAGLDLENNQLVAVYAPIWRGDPPQIVGVLETYEDRAFVTARIDDSRRALFTAGAAGLAVVFAVLFVIHRWGVGTIGRQKEGLIRQAGELKESYQATLEALGLAIDLRDDGTEGHCQRVSVVAMTVARELGLSGPEVEQVGQAAVVHDIGKMALPDAVLFKPGPLTDDEWREMRKHPELGYKMLKQVPVLQEAAETVHSHHERYDGTGYPRGLKGKEIPLAARIFAVVDAYDAITSDRPYRKALSHKFAMEEIVRCTGSQFDPEVVHAFCEMDRKGLYYGSTPDAKGMGCIPESRRGWGRVSGG